MKKILVICAVLACLAVFCAGCVAEEKTPEERILGTWVNPMEMEIDDMIATIAFVFNDDNTGVVEFRSNGIAVRSVSFRWLFADEGNGVQYYTVLYNGLGKDSKGTYKYSFLTIVVEDGKDYLYIFDGYSEGLVLSR